MFNERKSIESFNAYQCIRSYLVDLSIQELIKLAKDYGIEVAKASIGIEKQEVNPTRS